MWMRVPRKVRWRKRSTPRSVNVTCLQEALSSEKKMAKNGKLRVGWVNCRVKLREPSTRCYRCHEDGHTARECNSEVECSKQCFRCGQEGHKVVACTARKRGAAMEVEAPSKNG
ncbi:hypothetical protein KM043_000085 [Ampulex compressa]|nr:hypothetical protein KM043_000085 [Ampulex compressa]